MPGNRARRGALSAREMSSSALAQVARRALTQRAGAAPARAFQTSAPKRGGADEPVRLVPSRPRARVVVVVVVVVVFRVGPGAGLVPRARASRRTSDDPFPPSPPAPAPDLPRALRRRTFTRRRCTTSTRCVHPPRRVARIGRVVVVVVVAVFRTPPRAQPRRTRLTRPPPRPPPLPPLFARRRKASTSSSARSPPGWSSSAGTYPCSRFSFNRKKPAGEPDASCRTARANARCDGRATLGTLETIISDPRERRGFLRVRRRAKTLRFVGST